MQEQKTIEESFIVVGLSIKTNNTQALNEGSIQKLWESFFKEEIYSKVPNKIDNKLVTLYYDYENKKYGNYTFLLGVKVSSCENIPKHLTIKEVPATQRITFNSDKGALPEIVLDTWKTIWKLEDDLKIARSYTIDYEVHKCQANPSNSQVEIHIAVD